MPSYDDRPGRRRRTGNRDTDRPDAARPRSERRVYRTTEDEGELPMERRSSSQRDSKGLSTADAARTGRRSPLVALAVLIAVAVIFILVGLAARGGGLEGAGSDLGTFKLVPLTTTTS